MQLVAISDIVVPANRQRREFTPEAMGELQTSIEQFGLMHPLVVRDEGDTWVLVAGERRLRCISMLAELEQTIQCNNADVPPGLIPVVTLGELSPLEAMEAELDENIRRSDLTWQERAEAVKRLLELRQAQTNQKATVADVAEELTGRRDGSYQAQVRRQVIVAGHLDDAEVAKAKTLDDAVKVIKRKEQDKANVRLAQAVGQTFSASDHRALQGDCRQVMATLEPGSFDVILSDPPYGIDADQFGDAAGKMANIDHGYDDSAGSMKELLQDVIARVSALAKPAAHMYLFCDVDHFHWLRELAAANGWQPFRTPLILHKLGSGRVPLPEHGPRRTYECILYAFRGGRTTTAIYPDVLSVPGDDNLGHGAQKPVAAYVDLLRRSVRPGDRVLDPFMGTGTVFPAAHELKCYATGIEREEKYYGIALGRLKGLK